MDNDQANDGRMAGVYFFFSVFIGRKKQKGNGPVGFQLGREVLGMFVSWKIMWHSGCWVGIQRVFKIQVSVTLQFNRFLRA